MPHFARILESVSDSKWRRRLYTFERAFRHLLPLGGMSDGNHIETFTERDKIFEQMLSAIANASQRVWLETYILEPDAIGLRFRDALLQAASRGCEVILIYDHFGSSRLSAAFLKPILKAGGEAFDFNPIWPWRRQGPLLFRDHRKILIIDEDVSFCGSVNISSNPALKFRDTAVRIKGPATQDLIGLFLDSLYETTGQDKKNLEKPKKYSNGVVVQVLGSNQRRKLVSIQKSMEVTLKRAKRTCYFTTPYFLPYDRLRKAMIDAAKRGVDVRVLTAGLSDVPLMRFASHHVYGQFLKAGIRIYELFGQTLHAKTAAIDGIYASVGSYNLDHWSARRNLEVNVSVIDPHLTKELESHFYIDLKNAHEISLPVWKTRSYFRRILNFCAYQIMRL